MYISEKVLVQMAVNIFSSWMRRTLTCMSYFPILFH
jgi:hypothetical protein